MVDVDMVDVDMVDMVDVDMVDMDMVNRKFLVNFIYLGSLPRIISQTCLDSLVLLASPFERWATRETQKAGKGSSPLNLGII